jgi:predicted MFS family arabinose efflux permease
MNTTPSTETSLLRSKRYGLFWVSSLFSNMGTWMQQLAQPWIILSLNPSSFWVGIDSFALNAPGWIFTLWGGLLADRFERKRIILFFQSVQALCVLTLLLLLLLGHLKIWMILVISFLIGTTDAFSVPALQSIIPSLVKSRDIPRAVALNSAQFNLSRVVGPALAGFMIATYGAITCVGANLFSYLPFFLSIYWIYPRQAPKIVHSRSAESVQTGNQFLAILQDQHFQAPLISMFVTALFCSQLITFCSVIIKDVFHAGAAELGWSTAAFGLGGVIGAVIFSLMAGGVLGTRKAAVLVAAGLGGIVALVAAAPSVIFLDVCLFFAGLTLTLSNTSVNSNLQISATNAMRGQVASMCQLAVRGGISVGGLFTGTMTAKLGAREAFLINGILALLLQLLVFYRMRVNIQAPQPTSS